MKNRVTIIAMLAAIALLSLSAQAAETRLYLSNSSLYREEPFVFDTIDPEWGTERFMYEKGLVRGGVKYTLYADEECDDIRPVGLQKLIGHVILDGERRGDVYTLQHDEENAMLAVLFVDNEWMIYYCRSDIEAPDMTLAKCDRLEYILWAYPDEQRDPERKVIQDPQKVQTFKDAIANYSEEDARKRFGDQGDSTRFTYGYLYGYVSEYPYLQLEYNLSPYGADGMEIGGQDDRFLLDKALLR